MHRRDLLAACLAPTILPVAALGLQGTVALAGRESARDLVE